MLDGRKQPIRGLLKRNTRYYGRLSVENPNTGLKAMRRVPLLDADGQPVQTDAQAVTAFNRLKTQRADDALPQLGQTPVFADYAGQYLDYIKSGSGTKKSGTIAKKESSLALWKKHLGGLRLDKIKPVHVSAFVQKRLKAGLSKRTAKLDVIMLRNVLKRGQDIDQHIKALPIPPGLNRDLKSTPPNRSLFTQADVEKLCAAALAKKADGSPVTKNGQQFCDYIRLLAYSGARRNEALALRWQDVDMERGQLTIGSDGNTKNSTARVVDFNPNLKAHLRDMRERSRGVSQWLFPSPQRGERDVSAQTFRESRWRWPARAPSCRASPSMTCGTISSAMR